MRIALYSQPLSADKARWSDTDWFTAEVLGRLARHQAEDEFLWITPHAAAIPESLPDNITVLPLGTGPAHGLSARIRLRRKLPALLRDRRAEALFSFTGLLPPLRLPAAFLVRPSSLPAERMHTLLRQKTAFAVLSRQEKDELTTRHAISPNRVVAVSRGVRPGYGPMSWEQRQQIKDRYTAGKEYFIYPGDLKAENNILNLLKAFSVLKKRLHSGMVLILAGKPDRKYKDFPGLLRTYYFRSDVTLIPEATPEERIGLIGAAYGVVCPVTPQYSRPVMPEAFASGVPVITADSPPAREIGEDAAIYFNEQDFENIGDALCEIYKDEELRRRLIAVGDIQAGKYNWDKTAGLVWTTIRAALEAK